MSKIEEIRARLESASPTEFLVYIRGDVAYLLDEIARLTVLVQNGQSAIDANMRLAEKIKTLLDELAAKDTEIEQLKRELEIARHGYVNCVTAQREADGACLGFQISEQDDEPCEQCKCCPMCTGYGRD